jgi:hypothetical protein
MPHRAYRMPMSMIGNIHQVEVVTSVQRQSRWPAEREPYSDPPRVTLLESPGPSPGKEKYHASTSPHGRRFALQVKRALSIIVASRKYQRRCGKPVRVAWGSYQRSCLTGGCTYTGFPFYRLSCTCIDEH